MLLTVNVCDYVPLS